MKPLAFFSAALALWIDFGSLHEMDNSDGLIPILMSLYKWTPFYWGQDRFGALVPLLALPVKHPFWNLHLQWFLDTFAGVFSFVLGARYLFPVREWPLVAILGMALYFALTPLEFRFHYLGPEQPYALAMMLGFAALLVVSPEVRLFPSVRLLISYLLMSLAHWVNLGLVIIMVPMLLALAVSNRRMGLQRALVSEHGIGLVITIGGALSGLMIRQFFATEPTTMGLSSPQTWSGGWGSLSASLAHELAPQYWSLSLAIIAGFGLISLFMPTVRRRFNTFVSRPALLVAASIAYFLLVGMLTWVKDNLYSSRYLHPAVLIFQTAVVAFAVVPLGSCLSDRMLRKITVVGGAMVISAMYIGFGVPSAARVRTQVAQTDPVTSEVLAARCTHVAGDYWDVWPVVYRATLNNYEEGRPRAIYGITGRAGPTISAAKAVPPEQMRIALLPTPDGQGERWLHHYQFPPLTERARLSTIVVLARATGSSRLEQ